jgi:hypothetical protein
MTILICAAVRGGTAEGVSVTTLPDDRLRAECVATSIRKLRFDTARRMVVASTYFEGEGAVGTPALASSGAAGADFDRAAALAALAKATTAALQCRGPKGDGRVSIVFSPETGKATSVEIETFSSTDRQFGPEFGQTEAGQCTKRAFLGATIPPFGGLPVTVHKTFSQP